VENIRFLEITDIKMKMRGQGMQHVGRDNNNKLKTSV